MQRFVFAVLVAAVMQAPAGVDREMLVHVRDAQGRPLSGVLFEFQSQSASLMRVRRPGVAAVGDGDYRLTFTGEAGEFLAESDDPHSSFIPSLRAHAGSLGKKTIRVTPTQREVDIAFGAPASLDVRVANARPVDLKGRLIVMIQERVKNIDYENSEGDVLIVDTDGVASFDSLNTGKFVVTTSFRDRTETRGWNRTTLDTRTISLIGGENDVTIELPRTFTLTVKFADSAERTIVMVPHDASELLNAEAKDGRATFRDLVAGEYTIIPTVPTGKSEGLLGPGVMKLRVSESTTVKFDPHPATALLVLVDDAKGELARAGFASGDLIVGYDGVEASKDDPTSVFVDPKGPDSVKVLVNRNGQRLEFELTRADLRAQRNLGGKLWPSER